MKNNVASFIFSKELLSFQYPITKRSYSLWFEEKFLLLIYRAPGKVTL